jgi:flagellar assembly factor FliW
MMVAASSASFAPAEGTPARPVRSRLLGELMVAPAQVICFPEGLPGFPDMQEFALLAAPRDGFWWLQATSDDAVTFLLTDPFRVQHGYEVDLRPGDEAFLQLSTPDEALVLTIVTLPAAGDGPATTNLRGPLVLNLARQRGRQLVRADERFSLHAALALDA